MGNAANDHHTSTPKTPPVNHIIKQYQANVSRSLSTGTYIDVNRYI